MKETEAMLETDRDILDAFVMLDTLWGPFSDRKMLHSASLSANEFNF